jgi:hypothetical protein
MTLGDKCIENLKKKEKKIVAKARNKKEKKNQQI